MIEHRLPLIRLEFPHRALGRNGVQFERFDSLRQDELDVWTAPGGAKVAWFKDPDGNLLSVSQMVEPG